MASKGRLEYEADGESPVMRNAAISCSCRPDRSCGEERWWRQRAALAAYVPEQQEADRRDGEVIAPD